MLVLGSINTMLEGLQEALLLEHLGAPAWKIFGNHLTLRRITSLFELLLGFVLAA